MPLVPSSFLLFFFSLFFFFNPLIFLWLKFWVNYYWTWNSVHWLYRLAVEPRDAPASISPALGSEHILLPPMSSVWYGKHFAKWAISPDPVFAVFKADTKKFNSPQVPYMLNIVGTGKSTSTRHESERRPLRKKRPWELSGKCYAFRTRATSGVSSHPIINLNYRRQGQEDLCKFKPSLVYIT